MGYLAREGRTAMAVLLERGHSQSAVARLLGVSEGTVRYHRKRWASGVGEDQHISGQRSAGSEHGLGEEVAGNHAFNMCLDEGGPWQGRLFLVLLRARVDALAGRHVVEDPDD